MVSRSVSIIPLYYLIFMTHLHDALAQIRIEVSAPVNPVEETGILSIHCQVWNLESGHHEVSFLRTLMDGSTERLSLDGTILQDVDDRVFLAVRQIMDGSSVYFLSIVDTLEMDAGEYYCKVQNKAGVLSEVAYGSMQVDVNYPPPESDPLCHPNIPIYINEGEALTLNCSSETANPVVTLTWGQTGKESERTLESSTSIQGSRVHSKLTVHPTRFDNGAMYICTLQSSAFPSLTRTCHVGPINIIQSVDFDRRDGQEHGGQLPNTLTQGSPSDIPKSTDITLYTQPTSRQSASDCKKICSTFSYPMFQWVISTLVAGLFAFIFLILCATLLYKYNTIQHNGGFVLGVPAAEDIYSEVEGRRNENRLYMSLEKHHDRVPTQVVHSKELPPGHYDPMPKSTPKM